MKLKEQKIAQVVIGSGVGGGVTANDMEMLAHSKAAGWFVVSAIAGASDPEEATRNMVRDGRQCAVMQSMGTYCANSNHGSRIFQNFAS